MDLGIIHKVNKTIKDIEIKEEIEFEGLECKVFE